MVLLQTGLLGFSNRLYHSLSLQSYGRSESAVLHAGVVKVLVCLYTIACYPLFHRGSTNDRRRLWRERSEQRSPILGEERW